MFSFQNTYTNTSTNFKYKYYNYNSISSTVPYYKLIYTEKNSLCRKCYIKRYDKLFKEDK